MTSTTPSYYKRTVHIPGHHALPPGISTQVAWELGYCRGDIDPTLGRHRRDPNTTTPLDTLWHMMGSMSSPPRGAGRYGKGFQDLGEGGLLFTDIYQQMVTNYAQNHLHTGDLGHSSLKRGRAPSAKLKPLECKVEGKGYDRKLHDNHQYSMKTPMNENYNQNRPNSAKTRLEPLNISTKAQYNSAISSSSTATVNTQSKTISQKTHIFHHHLFSTPHLRANPPTPTTSNDYSLSFSQGGPTPPGPPPAVPSTVITNPALLPGPLASNRRFHSNPIHPYFIQYKNNNHDPQQISSHSTLTPREQHEHVAQEFEGPVEIKTRYVAEYNTASSVNGRVLAVSDTKEGSENEIHHIPTSTITVPPMNIEEETEILETDNRENQETEAQKDEIVDVKGKVDVKNLDNVNQKISSNVTTALELAWLSDMKKIPELYPYPATTTATNKGLNKQIYRSPSLWVDLVQPDPEDKTSTHQTSELNTIENKTKPSIQIKLFKPAHIDTPLGIGSPALLGPLQGCSKGFGAPDWDGFSASRRSMIAQNGSKATANKIDPEVVADQWMKLLKSSVPVGRRGWNSVGRDHLAHFSLGIAPDINYSYK